MVENDDSTSICLSLEEHEKEVIGKVEHQGIFFF